MSSTDRVGVFVPSMTIGGAERVMVNLSNGLAQKGYDVDLILIQCEGELLEEVSSDVRLIELNATRARSSLYPLITYLRQERPTAILSAMTHLNIIAILADLLSRIPVTTIVTEHNAQSQKDPVPREVALAKYLYLAADHVVGVSEGVADDISQWSARPRDRISAIYNPIVTEEMLDQDIAVPSHPWFSDEDIPVIVGAGRHVPQKDFSTLLQAMKSVRGRHQTDAKLVLLGDGPQTESLKILAQELSIEEHVSFPGFVDDLYPYIRWGDVFALSSRWEGFGNVLVEAMAFGTPVVSTDCPSGPAEILAQGDYGRLTPVGDADELSAAIVETLAHPPDSERLRRRARDFSVTTAAERYEQLLHSGELSA